jgi:signal transduction histidine kinase
MSVRLKLVILVVFVALVPISVSAYVSLGIHQRAIERNLTSLYHAVAKQEAQIIDSRLKNIEDNLHRLVQSTLPWEELSQNEQQAALWLLYRADEDIAAVMLLGNGRDLVTAPAYVTPENAAEEPNHVPQPPSVVAATLSHLATPAAHAGEIAVGQPFSLPGVEEPLLPLSLAAPNHTGTRTPLTVAVGVSLRSVCQPRSNPDGIELRIVGSARQRICAARHAQPSTTARDEFAWVDDSKPAVVTYYRNGQELLGAQARLRYGWHVIAEQPVASAYAASRAMLYQAILWVAVSVAIALTSGLLLARGISEPVRRLSAGAHALAQGDWTYRFELPERDEFGQLGDAFNRMAADLAARDVEIRLWNAELQQRVEERTRAIERYQSHLVQAERSAVIARLSAGVASEINDPLTGILGAVQIFSERARSDPKRVDEARLFANAEQAALRIRELIRRVQALSQRQPRSQLRPVVVADWISSALSTLDSQFVAAGIQVIVDTSEAPPEVLGNFTQLEHVLLQLLGNAIDSCRAARSVETSTPSNVVDDANGTPSRGHTIAIRAARTEQGWVSISLSDDGVGIPSQHLHSIFEPFFTLRAEAGAGLGLSIARRIIEEHGGTIEAAQNAGPGATLNLQLPPLTEQTPGIPSHA